MKTRVKLRTFSLIFLSLLLVLVAGCGGQDKQQPQQKKAANVPGVTDDTILVGSWVPMSGPAAAYGAAAKGMDAYFKKINDDGGVHGRKIRFIYEDDSYQPAKTMAIVKRMVEQDKVFAFCGGLGTSQNAAVQDYLIQHGVPNIAPASGTSQIANPPKKGWFALYTNYYVEGYIKTKFAVETLKAKRIATLVQNDDAGKEGNAGAKEYLKKQNMEYILELPFNISDLDFSSHILKIKEANPDAVSIGSVPKPIALFLKQAKDLGLKVPIICNMAACSSETLKMAGPAAEGSYFFTWRPLIEETDHPKVKRHIEIYKKYYPSEEPSSFTIGGQAYAELFVEGLKRAGRDLTRENFVEALEGIKNWNEGLANNVTFGPGQRQGQNSLMVVQVKGGKFVPVTGYIEKD